MDFFGIIWDFVKRYLLSIAILLASVYLIYNGLKQQKLGDEGEVLRQTQLYLFAGIALLIAGVVSLLYVSDLIKKMPHMALTYVIFPLIIVALVVFSFTSVKGDIDFDSVKKVQYREIKQNLKDLRDAQLEYRNKHKKFASTMDSLIYFIKNEEINQISKNGAVPDEVTREYADYLFGEGEDIPQFIDEEQTWLLAQSGQFPELVDFRRDTNQVKVLEKVFLNEKAMKKRKRLSDLPFNVDSLRYVPFSNGKVEFQLQAGSITKGNGEVPVFRIFDPNPMKFTLLDPEKAAKDTLIIGSLEKAMTNGNWDR